MEVLAEEDVFPRSTYNEKYDQDICTICQEDFSVGQPIVTLPCLHIFHADGSTCPGVVSWINQTGTCPICRTRVLNQRRPQWQANEFWVELSDFEREIIRNNQFEDDMPDFIDDGSMPDLILDVPYHHMSQVLDWSWPASDFVEAASMPDLVDAIPDFHVERDSNRSSASIYEEEDIDDLWLLDRISTYEESENEYPHLVDRSSSASRFVSEEEDSGRDEENTECGEEIPAHTHPFMRGRSCSTCSDRSRYTDEDSVYDNSVYDDITEDEVDAAIWEHIREREDIIHRQHIYRAESFEFLDSTSTQYERDYSISESWDRDSIASGGALHPNEDLIEAYYNAQPELIILRDLDSTESSYNANELEDSGGSNIEAPSLLADEHCTDFSRLCEVSEQLRLKSFEDISE